MPRPSFPLSPTVFMEPRGAEVMFALLADAPCPLDAEVPDVLPEELVLPDEPDALDAADEPDSAEAS